MSDSDFDEFSTSVETAAKITIVTIVGIVVAVIAVIVISIVIICCCICKRRNGSAGTVYRGAPVASAVTSSTTYHMPAPYYSPQPINYAPQGHMIPGGPAPPPYPGPPHAGPPQAYTPISVSGYPQYDNKAQASCPPPQDTQMNVLQKASAPPPEPY